MDFTLLGAANFRIPRNIFELCSWNRLFGDSLILPALAFKVVRQAERRSDQG